MTNPNTGFEHPDLNSRSMKADLDESELTAPTDGSASEEGGHGSWLGIHDHDGRLKLSKIAVI